MNILYTAFNGENNPSKILLDKIETEKENKLYLINSFTASVKQLEKELKNNEYDLVISFGQAPLDKDTIKIEIVGKGDKKYKTNYDYRLLKNVLDTNFKTIISDDAGTYLCNNIYYTGLKYIEEQNLKANMIFIHIPIIDNITNIDNLSDVFSLLV